MSLGTVLIAVAVAGGALGVALSERAERSASSVTDRYGALLVAVRQVQASGAAFQEVAEQDYIGSVTPASVLGPAEQTAQATDQDYKELHSLLALPSNAGLAPGLDQVARSLISDPDATVADRPASPWDSADYNFASVPAQSLE